MAELQKQRNARPVARRKKGRDVSGWLVLDKPQGLSSTALVNQVKRLYDAKKAGHGGTLDPLATGLLPIALGEATKTLPFITEAEKGYCFTLAWGIATDSDDAEGEIIARSEVRPDPAQVAARLAAYRGWIWQRPPAYSAIKVKGERAYDLARAGSPPDLPARQVFFETALLEDCTSETARIRIRCGKGFYVRALARDLAQDLGSYAHVTALRRTKVGSFDETHAISLSFLEESAQEKQEDAQLLPLSAVLDDIPALALEDEEAARFRTGQAVTLLRRSLWSQLEALQPSPPQSELSKFEPSKSEPLESGRPDSGDLIPNRPLLVTANGQELGLAQLQGGRLQPVRLFNLPLSGR